MNIDNASLILVEAARNYPQDFFLIIGLSEDPQTKGTQFNFATNLIGKDKIKAVLQEVLKQVEQI